MDLKPLMTEVGFDFTTDVVLGSTDSEESLVVTPAELQRLLERIFRAGLSIDAALADTDDVEQRLERTAHELQEAVDLIHTMGLRIHRGRAGIRKHLSSCHTFAAHDGATSPRSPGL